MYNCVHNTCLHMCIHDMSDMVTMYTHVCAFRSYMETNAWYMEVHGDKDTWLYPHYRVMPLTQANTELLGVYWCAFVIV